MSTQPPEQSRDPAEWPGPEWVASQELWPQPGWEADGRVPDGPAGTPEWPAGQAPADVWRSADPWAGQYGAAGDVPQPAAAGQPQPAAGEPWRAEDAWGPQDGHTAHEGYPTGSQPAINDTCPTGSQPVIQDAGDLWPAGGQWADPPGPPGQDWPAGQQWATGGPGTAADAWPGHSQWPDAAWAAGQPPGTPAPEGVWPAPEALASGQWPAVSGWPADGLPPGAAAGSGEVQQPWPPGPPEGWGMGEPGPAAGPGPGIPPQAAPELAGLDGPGPALSLPAAPVPAPPAPARPVPAESGPAADLLWAMIAYLGVPFFSVLLPLAVYLRSRRRSPREHGHAVQALNTSLTVLMYDISAAIMAGMLALDSPLIAVAVAGTMIATLWLVALGYLIRAASAAGQGTDYRIPHWLCATLIK